MGLWDWINGSNNTYKKMSAEQVKKDSADRSNASYNASIRKMLVEDYSFSANDLKNRVYQLINTAKQSVIFMEYPFVLEPEVKELLDELEIKCQKENQEKKELELIRQNTNCNQELREIYKFSYESDYVAQYEKITRKISLMEKRMISYGGSFELAEDIKEYLRTLQLKAMNAQKGDYKRETIRKYVTRLRSYEYQGVDVQMGNDLQLVDALFWDGYNKYGISCRCYSEDIISENVAYSFDEVFSFAQDKEIWDEDDITEQLNLHLLNSSFYDIRLYSHSKEKIIMFAYRDDIKYAITVRVEKQERKKIEEEKANKEYAQYYLKKFEETLQSFAIDSYEMEIGNKLNRLDFIVKNQYISCHLEIRCQLENLLKEEVEDAFQNVITYMGQLNSDSNDINQLVAFLEEKQFYNVKAYYATGSNRYIVAFREDINYVIKFYIEIVDEADDAIERGICQIYGSDKYIGRTEKIDIDSMEGHDFERFCAKVLEANGFDEVNVTQGSGDQGIDIIAFKDDIKYGIQCKCYSSDIGNKAVQEVFAGKTFYQCHVGVVLTNRYFTKSAIELARSSGIILWNRDKLLKMVEEYIDILEE